MPLTYFKCPDGNLIETYDCFAECRMSRRCSTLPWLVQIKASERIWDGTPHVTTLIQGTMEAFLKITEPFAVEPTGPGPAFAQLGIAIHSNLEDRAIELGHPAEWNFHNPGILQGSVDYLEPNSDGSYNMWDYKTWGSYKVAKARGIIAITTGKGKNRHTTKRYDPSKVDNMDTELQLNAYRVEAEKRGIVIKDMFVQAIVRDGNTIVAKNRAITESVSVVPVERLHDDFIGRYFDIKGEALKSSLNTNQRKIDLGEEFHPIPGDVEPSLCTKEETWGNTKCKMYCPVAYACPVGSRWKTNIYD